MFGKYVSLKKIALATLTLSALTQPVRASQVLDNATRDMKTYPGSMCTVQGVAGDPAISVNSFATLFNVSRTSFVTVVCPIVKDNHMSPGGIRHARIIVLDRNATLGHIQCTLFSREARGNPVEFKSVSAASNGDGLTLQINDLKTSPFSGGYYHLSCRIPPVFTDSNGVERTSGIVSYEIDEKLEDLGRFEIVDEDSEL